MSGSQQIFAPQPAPQISAPMLPSPLAAMMSQPHPLALQTPQMSVPLGTMAALAPPPAAPPDFTSRYNTPLTPEEQPKFNSWLQTLPPQQRNSFDYDMQGAWKSGAGQAGNGHFPDDFKKPNHPTFSDQSQYNGVDGYQGGKWGENDSFAASPTNVQMYGPEGLQNYFGRVEPDSALTLPPPVPPPSMGPMQ